MQYQHNKQQPSIQFRKFDLVWSKLTGYPWWPGRIADIPKQKSGKYKVLFIGDNTHAFLPANKLIGYAEGWNKYSTPQKIFKGFQAARAEADQLLASLSKETDGARGDYSQPKTVPDQQIQIFNQEVSINNSAHQVIERKQEKVEQKKQYKNSHKNLSKPFKSFKHLDESENHINKRKQIQKQERQAKQMLKKYHLDYIPQIDNKQEAMKCRINKRKRKIVIRRKQIQISQNDIRISFIRKLNQILRKKGISQSSQSRKIAVYLGYSLITKKNDGVKGAHRALFQWISNNDPQAIEKNYKAWQTSTQKVFTGFTQGDMKQQSQQ